MTTKIDFVQRDKVITKIVGWANRQFAKMVKDCGGDFVDSTSWTSRPLSHKLADKGEDLEVDIHRIVRDVCEAHDIDNLIVDYSRLEDRRPVIHMWIP